MSNFASSLLLRLACCLAASWTLWQVMGPIGLVTTAPLYGVLLARPILELASRTRYLARQRVFTDIEGRHFVHRGLSIDIVEDDDHFRWIRLSDVKKLLPALPRQAVLEAQFPGQVRIDASAREARILAEALLAYLAKSTEPDSIRFRNWIERDVVVPGASVRRRRGNHRASPADHA
jgi:hypothetical protein